MNANQIRSELAQNVLNRPTQEGCNLALIEIAAQLAELNAQLRGITNPDTNNIQVEVVGDVVDCIADVVWMGHHQKGVTL